MVRKYAIVAPFALALMLLCLPMTADADPMASPTATVTITAIPFVVSAPTNLVLTYVSDNTIDVAWTKGADAERTMVRAAYGYTPTDRDDGYLVYYGTENNVVDTSVDLAAWDVPIHYRAWSESVGGLWEETGIWDWIDGSVPTALQAFLVIGAAGIAAWRKHIIIYVAAFIMLVFLGIQLLAEAAWAFGLPTLIFAFYFIYNGAWSYWKSSREDRELAY